jgi:hypothetical protein
VAMMANVQAVARAISEVWEVRIGIFLKRPAGVAVSFAPPRCFGASTAGQCRVNAHGSPA